MDVVSEYVGGLLGTSCSASAKKKKKLVFQVGLASVLDAVQSHLIPWNGDKQSVDEG